MILTFLLNLSFNSDSMELLKARALYSMKILCPTGDKVFKNGPSKIYGRQPLNNFEGILSG